MFKTLASSRPPVVLWTLLRITSFFCGLLAFLYDSGGRTATTLYNYLLNPWYVYDTYHYVRIVRTGYQIGEVSSNFHPLYPLLSSLVNVLVRDPLLSLLLVSSVAGLMLTIVFYRLVRLDQEDSKAWFATALLLCWPPSVAIFVPYTEALFLLLAAGCLLLARKGNYWWAGILGGLATLTRQQGLFLALPLLWELRATSSNWSQVLSRWRTWLIVALMPAAYILWILYRAIVLADVQPDFSSFSRFIYSVMISPQTYQILDEQQFLPPWTAIWEAMKVIWGGGVHWGAYTDILVSSVFIAMFVLSWRHLRSSYRIYSLAIILVALSFHTGSINPYISLPRHMLLAFPVFIGFAARNSDPPLFLLGILALGQMLLLCSFVWQVIIL